VTSVSGLPIGSMKAVARNVPVRAAALVGLVLLAYNYSLLTLARGLTLQTPLAYVALVPVIALILGIVRLRTEPAGLPIHDRQVDWIVGFSLLALTAAVLLLAPSATSSTFWLDRIDLLTMPHFVGGLIALLFGVRRLWALKAPLAFLLLAWPIPFTLFLSQTAGPFAEFTASVVGAVTKVIPIARQGVTQPDLFMVGSGPSAFAVSIGTACAGVNSVIGFLLLGAAFLFVVRGSNARRAAWLTTGLLLVFGMNVVRILLILVVGSAFGQEVAMDVLHPVAGMLVFMIGVVGMVVLVPRFGLSFIDISRKDKPTPPAGPSPVRRARAAMVVALATAVVLGVSNAAYARYEAISSGLADARLTTFDVRTAQVPGWETSFVANFIQVRQYFGPTSTWERVMYLPTERADVTSTKSVYVDVVTTDNPNTFQAFGLEACYVFHGFDIQSVTTVDVGAGVRGQVIDYTNTKAKADWSALWWEWPYTEDGKTRYERIVIFMANGPRAEYTGIDTASLGDLGTQEPRFESTDRFLVTLGRAIVRSQLETATP
jgi:exosortase